MKRALLGVFVALVLLFTVFFFAVGKNFLGLVPAKSGQVAPGVRAVLDGYVNAFLIDLDDGVALVDCGNDPEAKALFAALGERGLEPSAVKAIFITHGHADHIGGCAKFPSAMVYGFQGDRGLMEGTEAAKGPLPKLMGPQKAKATKLGTPLVDGAVVQLGSVGVQAWHLPGHTGGSAAFLVRDVLFLGDSATAEVGGALRGAPWVFSDDVEQSKASLRALAGKVPPTVKVVAFSHSGPVDGLAGLTAFAAER